jgi:hypothetical protein
MKNILIAGDSWGVGVFTGQGDSYGPTGEGIHSIFQTDLKEFQLTNVSRAGASNKEIVELIRPNHRDVDIIVFIQTDAFREHSYHLNSYKILHQDFINSLVRDYDSISQFFDQYYNRLYSELNSFNKPIICIGGWSKLHPSIVNYKNLISAIPSATQLIVSELEEDVYLSDFEWFPQLNDHKDFFDKFKDEIRPIALASSRKFELLCNHCGDCHPNLLGYKILVKNFEKYLFQTN